MLQPRTQLRNAEDICSTRLAPSAQPLSNSMRAEKILCALELDPQGHLWSTTAQTVTKEPYLSPSEIAELLDRWENASSLMKFFWRRMFFNELSENMRSYIKHAQQLLKDHERAAVRIKNSFKVTGVRRHQGKTDATLLSSWQPNDPSIVSAELVFSSRTARWDLTLYRSHGEVELLAAFTPHESKHTATFTCIT